MNKVKKGDDFENKVFEYFEAELKANNLYVNKKTSELHRKKGYYSRDREAKVIIDISIESSNPGAKDYSVLTVIECKDYSGTIPIDDIQELHDKVRQVAGDKGKAIFVTTAALQKGALTYAKNNQIAIIRFLPDNQVNWTTYLIIEDMMSKVNKLSSVEFNAAFSNQNHIGDNRDFYFVYNNYIFGDLRSILKTILNEE